MSRIRIHLTGKVAVLRIHDPATRNALSQDLLDELLTSIASLESSPDVSSVVVTGAEGVFAAGANIGELSSLSAEAARAFAKKGQDIFKRIYYGSKLYIAAVDGYCMGGGLDLALSCSIRFASPRSSFAHPGPRLGIITGWGGTQLLPRIVGRGAALEMLLTGRVIQAPEALRIGLISRIASDPVDVATQTGSTSLVHSPLSV